MRTFPVRWLLPVLLVAMFALMIGPARQDSATVDETTFLSAGYTYWKGYRFTMVPEHPPLSQMLPAVPLLLMDLKFSPNAKALLEGTVGYPWTVPWSGPPRAVQELFPEGRNNWYFVPTPESQMFGQMFVYDGTNNGDQMLFWGRVIQILLTLVTGWLIFYWVQRVTANGAAALIALALWVFNPIALAYGHLITNDISVTPPMVAAVLSFALFLEKPSIKMAAFCGAATGVALVMKYTATILVPVFVVLAAVSGKKLFPAWRSLWKLAAVMAGAAWLIILLAYFPKYSPAPPLSDQQATALGIPDWFRTFRTLLIPPGFFKGLALKLAKSEIGHDAYLMGKWSQAGWWYYFPLAFFFKSPLAFVIMVAAGAAVFIRQWKSAGPLGKAPWLAAAVFMLTAMTSHVNIGVRHLLPIFPLLCVGIGCAVARLGGRKARAATFVLLTWQAIVVIAAYPLYIQSFTEAVGGAENGYKYLVDSNFDWGQDANRLKRFLDERGIQHIYLDYFGTQFSIEHLRIPNTRVNADQAKQIRQGCLVVSTSELMRPEWAWLRASRQPTARVAHTLFVYQI